MKPTIIGRAALIGTVAALLAACGGSQPPIGAPGAMPQSHAIGSRADHSATSGDLLYVDDYGFNGGGAYAVVYSYPKGKHAGKLSGFFGPLGECSDSNGNVFIVASTSSTDRSTSVFEYAHGGSTPIAVLSEPGKGYGCAFDSTTGNLAVANIYDESNPYYPGYGDLAVFAGAQGKPTMYYPPIGEDFYYCGYDNNGDLYLSASTTNGLVLARLRAGSSSIEIMNLDVALHYGYQFSPSVQWDGKQMTVSSTLKDERNYRYSGPINVYQLSISGSSATVIGTTTLNATQERHRGESWIQGGTIIGVNYYKGRPQTTFWKYPEGGNPTHEITHAQKPSGSTFIGVTISVAPSRYRTHR